MSALQQSQQIVDDETGRPLTELAYVNLIIDAQRANGAPVDPAGAKRLVIALRAVGLIKFD